MLLQEHGTARETPEAFAPSSFLFLLLLLMLLLQQEMIVNQSIINAVKELDGGFSKGQEETEIEMETFFSCMISRKTRL